MLRNSRQLSVDGRQSAEGNVFLIILVAVALFAALAFTVSRGFRSTTTATMTGRELALAASDVVTYSQQLERAVNRLRSKGTSENDISFDQSYVTGYDHTPAQPETNKIFSPTGASVTWKSPVNGANDASPWLFTGESCVVGVGNGSAGCGSDGLANEELLAVLPNVVSNLCTEINKRLGITGIPADSGGGPSSAQFTGDFADGTEIVLAGGPYNSACFSFGGANYFYTVLLAR